MVNDTRMRTINPQTKISDKIQQLFPEQYFFPLQKVKKSISGVAE